MSRPADGLGRPFARVEEDEAARPVGVLGAARLEAGLAEERRLLVAGDPRHRDLAAELGRRPVDAGGGQRLRQPRRVDPEQRAELLVPAPAVDVEEHRPRGVGVVGGVAAGELEDEPGVDRAERRPLGPLDVARQPLDLGPGEVGVEDQARALADELLVAGGAQLLAAPGGAPVLPDQRPVQRLAARRVPGDDGLALVGDPDPVELRPVDRRRRRSPRRRPAASPPRSRRRRARPSPAAGSAARTRSRRGRRSAPRGRRGGRWSRSFPGRSRGSSAEGNEGNGSDIVVREDGPLPLSRSSPASRAGRARWRPSRWRATSAGGCRARWSRRLPGTASPTPPCASWSAWRASPRAPSTNTSRTSRTASSRPSTTSSSRSRGASTRPSTGPATCARGCTAGVTTLFTVIAEEQAAASLVTVESLTLGAAAVPHRERAAAHFEELIRRVFEESPTPQPVTALTVRGIVAGIRNTAYHHLREGRGGELPAAAAAIVEWILCFDRPAGEIVRSAAQAAARPSKRPPATTEPDPDSLDKRERIVCAATELAFERGLRSAEHPGDRRRRRRLQPDLLRPFPRQAGGLPGRIRAGRTGDDGGGRGRGGGRDAGTGSRGRRAAGPARAGRRGRALRAPGVLRAADGGAGGARPGGPHPRRLHLLLRPRAVRPRTPRRRR